MPHTTDNRGVADYGTASRDEAMKGAEWDHDDFRVLHRLSHENRAPGEVIGLRSIYRETGGRPGDTRDRDVRRVPCA